MAPKLKMDVFSDKIISWKLCLDVSYLVSVSPEKRMSESLSSPEKYF